MNPFDGTGCLLRELMEVIKQRMQVHGSPFRSVFKCAASVFRTEGLRAFYISYPTTLMMSVPFNVIPGSFSSPPPFVLFFLSPPFKLPCCVLPSFPPLTFPL